MANGNSNYVKIEIDGSSNILSVLSQLPIKFDFGADYTFEIEYGCTTFIESGPYIILVTLINELRANGSKVIVLMDTEQRCQSINYASRINFFKNLEIPFDEQFIRRSTKNSLLEITQHPMNCWAIDERVISILENTLNIRGSELDALLMLINEITCNVTIHSNSKNGAYIYCQRFPRRNKLRLIISDYGIGIKSTLGNKYPDYTNLQILQESIKFGVTNGAGRGLGLFYVSEYIRRNNGNFTLISGENYISLNGFNTNFGTNSVWSGTIIDCTFNLHNQITLVDILSSLSTI